MRLLPAGPRPLQYAAEPARESGHRQSDREGDGGHRGVQAELQHSLPKDEFYRLTRTKVNSYDKHLFAQKRDKVFELTLDLAINHQKWAA